MLFIVLRHRFCTIQGILREEPEKVSQLMIRWARGIARESIVIVDGVIQKPPPSQAEVRGTTIHQFEVKIRRVRTVPLRVPVRCLTRASRCLSLPLRQINCLSKCRTCRGRRSAMSW